MLAVLLLVYIYTTLLAFGLGSNKVKFVMVLVSN
jgi:hypothetical protein